MAGDGVHAGAGVQLGGGGYAAAHSQALDPGLNGTSFVAGVATASQTLPRRLRY